MQNDVVLPLLTEGCLLSDHNYEPPSQTKSSHQPPSCNSESGMAWVQPKVQFLTASVFVHCVSVHLLGQVAIKRTHWRHARSEARGVTELLWHILKEHFSSFQYLKKANGFDMICDWDDNFWHLLSGPQTRGRAPLEGHRAWMTWQKA